MRRPFTALLIEERHKATQRIQVRWWIGVGKRHALVLVRDAELVPENDGKAA